eukprot:gene11216-20404_t
MQEQGMRKRDGGGGGVSAPPATRARVDAAHTEGGDGALAAPSVAAAFSVGDVVAPAPRVAIDAYLLSAGFPSSSLDKLGGLAPEWRQRLRATEDHVHALRIFIQFGVNSFLSP